MAEGLLRLPAMATMDDVILIRRLIHCLLTHGDCEMRRQVREELKLLLAHLRLKMRRRRKMLNLFLLSAFFF